MLVREIFPTIQGEGPHAGTPAVFVRLAGCPLRCVWCDTDFREEASTEMSPGEIAQAVQHHRDRQPSQLVVITGGEPMAHPLLSIILAMRKLDDSIGIQIETSGIMRRMLPPHVDVVVSPKTPSINYTGPIRAYKYIIRAGELLEDGLPVYATQGKDMGVPLARPSQEAPIYVQPCDEHDEFKNAANLEATLFAVREHGYRLSLQLHKVIKWA